MINVIRRVVRRAYGVPIVGYLLALSVGILTLPRTRSRVRATMERAKRQRRALRAVKRRVALAITRVDVEQAVDRAVRANPTAVALKGLLPSFMSAIGSVRGLAFQVAKADAAVAALDAKVDAALRRLGEAASTSAGNAGADVKVALVEQPAAEVLAPGKLKVRPLKLNLACGDDPLVGYVNVDSRRLPGVDIVTPLERVPLEPNSVDAIHSAHLLEHLDLEMLELVHLPFWARLLRAGGQFTATVLDADAMVRSYAEGVYSIEEFREGFLAAQGHDGGHQLNMVTPESLANMMRAAGFTETTIVAAGRRNGKIFEFEISGIRA